MLSFGSREHLDMKTCEPVILQGHMDMVGEKRPGSDHDFKKDGLKLYVEDGFIKAKDTTLGGDDGIAVAMAMAILIAMTFRILQLKRSLR